jgi:aminomethyltransferase
MTVLGDVHEDHGATFVERGGRRAVGEYGRPESAHRAVRNGVGLIEQVADVLVVTGDDRVEYVDNTISNTVPQTDGTGTYALMLTPQGRIETDMYVFNAGDKLLLVLPPGEGDPLAEEWLDKTFIQDVDCRVATDDFAVFGVHGPQATEKIASVLSVGTPEESLSFVRGSAGDVGLTVIRTDAPTGETGYQVVCDASHAERVFDTLETRGLNAAPFGYQTWDSLTLEAGTPLFESELDGQIPNSLGIRNAIDFEKGCFVGQEVLSRIENRGELNRRLIGLEVEAVPDAGSTVALDGDAVGEVTRALDSPTLGTPLALALVDAEGIDAGTLTVRAASEYAASVAELPFVEGSERSARLPTY